MALLQGEACCAVVRSGQGWRDGLDSGGSLSRSWRNRAKGPAALSSGPALLLAGHPSPGFWGCPGTLALLISHTSLLQQVETVLAPGPQTEPCALLLMHASLLVSQGHPLGWEKSGLGMLSPGYRVHKDARG